MCDQCETLRDELSKQADPVAYIMETEGVQRPLAINRVRDIMSRPAKVDRLIEALGVTNESEAIENLHSAIAKMLGKDPSEFDVQLITNNDTADEAVDRLTEQVLSTLSFSNLTTQTSFMIDEVVKRLGYRGIIGIIRGILERYVLNMDYLADHPEFFEPAATLATAQIMGNLKIEDPETHAMVKEQYGASIQEIVGREDPNTLNPTWQEKHEEWLITEESAVSSETLMSELTSFLSSQPTTTDEEDNA